MENLASDFWKKFLGLLFFFTKKFGLIFLSDDFFGFFFDDFFLGLKKMAEKFLVIFLRLKFFVQIFSSKFLVVIKIFFDFFELEKWGGTKWMTTF